MAEINLLDKYPKSTRPIEERGKRKLSGEGWLEPRPKVMDNDDILIEYRILEIVRQFGKEYFDGDRLYGYGGYYYNPRFWSDTIKRFQDYYSLTSKSKILDVGCAKGFMLFDFMRLIPGIHISGIDISRYALENAHTVSKGYLVQGNALKLPFPDNSFDLVVSINTLHNLEIADCHQAILEIIRVSKKYAFITVDAWRSEEEKRKLLQWNLTAKTYMSVDDWKKFFYEIGYTGDYYWFIAE
jgi:SAM-dependent methyltransferase